MAFDHQAFVSDLMNRPDVSINQFGRTSTELCVLLGSLILTKGYDKDKPAISRFVPTYVSNSVNLYPAWTNRNKYSVKTRGF